MSGTLGRWVGATLAAAAGAAASAWAQAPGDACALMGKDEFQAVTGKQEWSEPVAMPFAGASVCGFENGQILLWTGQDAAGGFDRLLSAFGEEALPRTPVEGLGDGAFAVFFDPEDEYQDHGAFVVFGAGPPTVAVAVYAEDGQKAEAALPQAMAVAQAVAARLR